MKVKSLARLILASIGIALLLAGLFLNNGIAAPGAQGTVTPTRDRLAQPTLPASPSQADHGAYVYWLSCLPCHGDLGQGLTDEFRQAYPPEDRNCWESGCHGERPYEDGFKLPVSIPAVVGEAALQKYANTSVLQAYIKAAMPFWKPGSLTDEDAWAVTAFLLRESGLLDDDQIELDGSIASQVSFHRESATATPAPVITGTSSLNGLLVAALVVVMIAVLALLLWLMRRRGGGKGIS